MKININLVLPRHNARVLDNLKYWKKRKTYPPLNVCYCKDIDKFMILNGHHRYFAQLEKGTKDIDVVIDKIQYETEFDKYKKPILK